MAMAGKQIPGDGLPANIAGMSKNQLYDIMSQMKALIEQNQQQARQILIQNPLLTKGLFQAQIMLGMLQPPQVIPNIQAPAHQHTQQLVQPPPQSNIQPVQSMPGQVDLQDQASALQAQAPVRKQHHNQHVTQISNVAATAVNLHAQPMTPHHLQAPQQTKGQLNPPMSLPQSSQFPNVPPHPIHSASQTLPLHQAQMPTASSQLQQPLQTTGIPHLPLQPTLPPQARPSVPSFHHQYAPQMGPNVGFPHPGAPQHLSHPMYHSGSKHPTGIVPSFSQGQAPLPSQPPSQSLYQSQLTPEMEKALLQQVMSLTPEQINLLPPEQRSQVLQLQQMLRQ